MGVFSSPQISYAQDEVLLYNEDFEDGEAQGWELEDGWELIQDGDNHVLAGSGHRWSWNNQEFGEVFRLGFRLKLLGGSIHLVFHNSPIGRYFISFHQNGSQLNKQYYPDVFQERLAFSNRSHSLGTWQRIEIEVDGSRIRFLVDGEEEWAYEDAEALTRGAIAFETLDDSHAFIDDIQVFGSPGMAVPTPDATLSWVRTGGPLGGLGYDVRMRPDNPDWMFVTDAFAGVFMSRDGGQNWTPTNQGILARVGPSGDSIPIFCLTIDPHNPDIVWAGTQNVRGIYKSQDGGQTWVEKVQGIVEQEGITFRGITVDPRSSDIIYAAAELSSWVWAGEVRQGREFDLTGGVVYKSEDGGEHWKAIWRGDNLARYIWINPQNSDILYVSTGIFDREAANSDPQTGVPGGEGVLKSTDGGKTWMNINNGLNNLYVGTLFMHPDNPEILLAGTGNNQYFRGNGVYITTDGGQNWQQTLRDDNINAVEFAASNPDIAYAGSAGAIYRSQDGGFTWERVSGDGDGWGPPGVRAGFPIDFQVDPRDPNRIFANEYGGGNLLSTDGGRTWVVASTGYTGAQVRDIAVDPASGQVYAAARSGVFISQDGGNTWEGLNYPPAWSMEWYEVVVDPQDSDRLLAANNWNGTILVSADGGKHWKAVTSPLEEGMAWREIVFASHQSQVVYAATSAYYSAGTFDNRMPAAGIFRSLDGGEHWVSANDSLSQDANATDIAVHPQVTDVVYAATGNKGLLKSTDGGNSWRLLNEAVGQKVPALSVALNPKNPEEVFVGYERLGIYHSLDGGESWQPSSAGLNAEASISDILFQPGESGVIFAADLFSGVYRSLDNGESWQPLNQGLRTRAVNKMAISSDGAHLYAATDGEGVFRLDFFGEPPQVVQRETEAPKSPTETPVEETSPVPEVTETELGKAATEEPEKVGGLCSSGLFIPAIALSLIWLNRKK